MICYTRNFEDVILNRVFADIPQGFFLDIGACHPVGDNNTNVLYQRGWRGVNVDPQASLAPLWQKFRPQDVFLSVACAATAGRGVLNLVPQYGQCASMDPGVAEAFCKQQVEVHPVTVPIRTGNELLETYRPQGEIHLLSIDVEGFEAKVLAGLDLRRWRPWVLLIEATIPGKPLPSHQKWEPMLLAADYALAYCDGVNRFYVSHEQASRLLPRLQLPPNVWDDFIMFREVQLQEQLQNLQLELTRLRTVVNDGNVPMGDKPGA